MEPLRDRRVVELAPASRRYFCPLLSLSIFAISFGIFLSSAMRGGFLVASLGTFGIVEQVADTADFPFQEPPHVAHQGLIGCQREKFDLFVEYGVVMDLQRWERRKSIGSNSSDQLTRSFYISRSTFSRTFLLSNGAVRLLRTQCGRGNS